MERWSGRAVVVLTAMDQELAPLRRPLRLGSPDGRAPRSGRRFRGRVRGYPVVAGVVGVGTAAAARSTAAVLDEVDAVRVLMVGVAGSVEPGLPIGAVVTPALVVDHATGAALQPGSVPGRRVSGSLLTTDVLLDRPEHLVDLRAAGIVAVDMETAAVGRVCAERGVPWTVHRAISDRAGEPATDEAIVGLLRPDGSADAGAALRLALGRPAIVPHLVRLGLGTDRAARAAARSALAELLALTELADAAAGHGAPPG